MVIMAVSILATLILVLFQSYVVRRTGSVAIKADRLHYLGDLIPNLAVIAALALIGMTGFDLAGSPVRPRSRALFSCLVPGKPGREALDMLMDRELPDEIRHKVTEIALSEKGVMGPA